MLHGVLLKSLRDVRRSFAWWSLGLAGYVVLIVGLWPTIRDNPALAELEESYPEELKAFFSFGGFDFSTASRLSRYGAVLVDGAAACSSSLQWVRERARSPVRRSAARSSCSSAIPSRGVGSRSRRLGHSRSSWSALAAVLFAMLAVATTVADMDVSVGDLASATTSAFLLSLVFGSARVRARRGHRP